MIQREKICHPPEPRRKFGKGGEKRRKCEKKRENVPHHFVEGEEKEKRNKKRRNKVNFSIQFCF